MLVQKDGGGIQVALVAVVADFVQYVALLLRLDVFGQHRQIEAGGQLGDGLDDFAAILVFEQALDQGAVQLDLVKQRVLEIIDGGLAHGEVVDGQQGRDDGAAVDGLAVRLDLHVRTADGEGHVYGQHAERRRIDQVEQAVNESVAEGGDEGLVSIHREGLDNQRKGADDQHGDHIDQTATDRTDDRRLLDLADKTYLFRVLFHVMSSLACALKYATIIIQPRGGCQLRAHE